jgi:hypothetical protein
MSRFSGGANVAATAAPSGPQLGDHGSDFDLEGSGTSPQVVTIDTQAAGSSILAITFGRFANYGAPTENKGNTPALLETSGYHGGLWFGYGLEAYGVANAAGGTGHAVTVTKTTGTEESTLIVVEARGTTIQDTSVVTRAAAGDGVAYTSASVTTTGPALLIAAWGGDGGTGVASQEANPEEGWTVVEELNLPGTPYIQACVAVKAVSAAGTYTCDWAPVSSQGAILFMAAVQA